MASTFWTDGYRDAQVGRQYSPPEHSAASVFTAEYQRGYNAFYDERAIELRPVSPRIAAKLARCEEMARMQKLKTRQVLTDCMWTDDDAAILGPRIFAFQSDDVAMRWTNNLNA